jgi:hypothetical protein
MTNIKQYKHSIKNIQSFYGGVMAAMSGNITGPDLLDYFTAMDMTRALLEEQELKEWNDKKAMACHWFIEKYNLISESIEFIPDEEVREHVMKYIDDFEVVKKLILERYELG